MTVEQMKVILTPIEAREVERIETDLEKTFGSFAPVVRLWAEETVYSPAHPDWNETIHRTEVDGWHVLGGVYIDRYLLPVDGSPVEEDGSRDHRRDILKVMLGAFESGRKAAPFDDTAADPDLAAAMARLEGLHKEFDANEAKIARALRGRYA